MKRSLPESFIGNEAVVSILQNGHKRNKLAHAYCFSGPEGAGKSTLALLLARKLLCTKADTTREWGCTECSSCTQCNVSQHADLLVVDVVESIDPSTMVEEVRRLQSFIFSSSFNNGKKILILENADRLNSASYNSLLKVFEEPPENVLLILVTAWEEKIPATIRSRCQRLRLGRTRSTHATEADVTPRTLATFLSRGLPGLTVRYTAMDAVSDLEGDYVLVSRLLSKDDAQRAKSLIGLAESLSTIEGEEAVSQQTIIGRWIMVARDFYRQSIGQNMLPAELHHTYSDQWKSAHILRLIHNFEELLYCCERHLQPKYASLLFS